jgi:hypothetical protein
MSAPGEERKGNKTDFKVQEVGKASGTEITEI